MEELSILQLHKTYETPFYVVSQGALESRVRAFHKEMTSCGIDGSVYFAVKACSNIAILRILGQAGCGADIVSRGEMLRALDAGISPRKMVFSGVGKTKKELQEALIADVGQCNVECTAELDIIAQLAQKLGIVARIGLRVNPDVLSDTHGSIATGGGHTKFGIPIEQIIPLACKIQSMKNIELCGLSVHIGSNIKKSQPFEKAFSVLAKVIKTLRDTHRITIPSVNVGGGLGESSSFTLRDYMLLVRDAFADLEIDILFEPGRWMCVHSAVLVMSVLYVKRMGDVLFVITDAGMNDFMRPVLYNAYHPIVHVDKKDTHVHLFTVTGPICETGDYLAKKQELSFPSQGDVLALLQAGAYGSAISSTMNSRPLIAEVLVKERQHALIRKPFVEIWRQYEQQPPWSHL